MLEHELQRKFVQALLAVPVTATMEGRDTLLMGLPHSVIAGLYRSNNRFVDLTNLISQLERLERLEKNGERALLLMAQNAIPMVEGTSLAETLWEIKHELERHYGEVDSMEPASQFIAKLKQKLLSEKGVRDISQDFEALKINFLGVRATTSRIDLVALVQADGLSQKDIIQVRDELFEITRALPQTLNMRTYGRMPNGLLGLVFENQISPKLDKFIKQASKISHSPTTPAVVVPWTVDLTMDDIYLHQNPVSWFPPVVILPGQVFPGLEYLKGFVQAYPKTRGSHRNTNSSSKQTSNSSETTFNQHDQTVHSQTNQVQMDLILLHQKLNQMFDDVELDIFCMDHFPSIFDKFSEGMRKDKKINLLLDYCRRTPEEYQTLKQLLADPDSEASTPSTASSSPIHWPQKIGPLSFSQKMEFVNLLLASSSISIQSRRQSIINELRDEIKNNVTRSPIDHDEVVNLVNACLDYDNGLKELSEIIRYFEGSSIAMQNLDDFLGKLPTD